MTQVRGCRGLCACHFCHCAIVEQQRKAMEFPTLRLVARRCKYYLFINAFICSVAIGSHKVVVSVDRDGDTFVQLFAVYSVSLLRILAMIKWFQWIATKKPQINGETRVQLTGEQVRAIYLRILWLVVPTECVSFWFAEQTTHNHIAWHSFAMEYAAFIPKSLVFEVIFDFFHFVMHWVCHYSSWLYRNVHKRHHLHLHPCPLSTYEQDGFDLCLTNVLPFCLAFSCGFPFSDLQLHLLFAYKTYVEVAGHSGLDIKGFSFPQMPLLNNVTSICLRVHDHDLHHTHPRWNFAKRFSLWDKLFRTFRQGKQL